MNSSSFHPGGLPIQQWQAHMDHRALRKDDEIPNLFDKFYEANGSNKRAGGGASLGLNIATNIIEAHGGHTRVESELDMGSAFPFVLSAQSGKKQDAAEAVSSVNE